MSGSTLTVAFDPFIPASGGSIWEMNYSVAYSRIVPSQKNVC